MNTILIDHTRLDPESLAMLQAFYSRSHTGVEERLLELGNDMEKVKEALKTYYIGYGHASIGDCATVTVFVEGVDLTVAKALQDHQLYNGQESSTRYIAFGAANTDIPEGAPRELYEGWIDAYNKVADYLQDRLSTIYPEISGRALRARAFDAARGLLPTGVKTQLSITMTFRQFNDHMRDLMAHPHNAVRETVEQMHADLIEQYPNAIRPLRPSTANPNRFYLVPEHVGPRDVFTLPTGNVSIERRSLSNTDNHMVDSGFTPVLDYSIPENLGPEYPDRIYDLVPNTGYANTLDYGSYRDLQRHRRGFIRASRPSLHYGMNQWYIDQYQDLPEELQASINNLIERWFAFESVSSNRDLVMLVTPLAANVVFVLDYSITQLVYVFDLRSKPSVHPSLRRLIHEFYESLEGLHPFFKHVGLNVDYTGDGVYVERGSQTITKNGQEIK